MKCAAERDKSIASDKTQPNRLYIQIEYSSRTRLIDWVVDFVAWKWYAKMFKKK
jgi:hypothetical protein